MRTDNAAWLISELSGADRPALERHFLKLDADDRRLRFGAWLPDASVRAYVGRIDFPGDAVFGVFDDDLELAAVAHLARTDGQAELGISVLAQQRSRGLGSALLARAVMRARNWGVRALYIHCLAENTAMMHLARKQGMDLVTQAAAADAWLELAPADAASLFGEALARNVALFDYALKRERSRLRALLGSDAA